MKKPGSSQVPFAALFPMLVCSLSLIAFSAEAGLELPKIEIKVETPRLPSPGEVLDKVKETGQKVVDEGTKVVEKAGEVTKAATDAAAAQLHQAAQVVRSVGGDGANLLGDTLEQSAKVSVRIGEAGTNAAISGVTKPTAQFANSMFEAVGKLGEVDLAHPERLVEVVRLAGAASSGLVLSAERSAERTAMDLESLAASTLPKPLESGVRHLAGEAIRELEKKNPGLAKALRFLPLTSHLYNHLRMLAGEEMACDATRILATLDAAPNRKIDDAARWSSLFTSPGFKGAGISGWTQTGCRATALGVAVRDGVASADNVITIDLRLAALNVGGVGGDVAGRYLRVEVLPLGRAHQLAMARPIREGEGVLVSGAVLRDEDLPDGFWEVHPVDDLEVVSVPAAPAPQTRLATVESRSSGGHAPPMRFTTYRVRRGDTLSSIAYAFSGRPDWMPILAANTNLVTHPNRLVAGWNLSIPIKTSRGFATISN